MTPPTPITDPAGGESEVLLEIEDLRTHFFLDEGVLRAVDGVDLTLNRHRTLGVIGESGCGKSVMAQSILRIVPRPGEVVGGRILLHERGAPSGAGGNPLDLAALDSRGSRIRGIRGGTISMIFQEPMTSLSPVHTVGDQVAEIVLQHLTDDKKEARDRAVAMLARVGIPNPGARMKEYPHQLSGGLRQRAMIAMALACDPELLIADEPTTALDVTVQAQILELMQSLQQQLGMAILFITHDLGVIAGIADEVAVMYLGRVVEYGPVREIFHHPRHPYTVGLLKSVPRMGRGAGYRLEAIAGTVPLPMDLPAACGFFARCQRAVDGRCDAGVPELEAVGDGHYVRCIRHDDAGEEL